MVHVFPGGFIVLPDEDIPDVCAEYAPFLLPCSSGEISRFVVDAEGDHFGDEFLFTHLSPFLKQIWPFVVSVSILHPEDKQAQRSDQEQGTLEGQRQSGQ